MTASAIAGNSRTEISPAAVSAAPEAAGSTPKSYPIFTAATMNGSDVACRNPAAMVRRVPSCERYSSAGSDRTTHRHHETGQGQAQ